MGTALACFLVLVALTWALLGAPAAMFLLGWFATAAVSGCVLGRFIAHGRG